MAPRKRAKASAASTPLAETQPKSPQDDGAGQSQDDVQPDPWADEQETQLFKSMMKWKPTGLHKHFRMISIHNDMRSHGYATEDAPHTRIPGIWKKLHQLYDLETLDAREVEFVFSDDPDPVDPEEAGGIPEFELPEDEFGEMMWHKRFHREDSAAASSPAQISIEDDKALYAPGIGLLKDLPNSQRSQKAESVAEATPTPTPKNAKGTRASRTNAKGGKGAKAASNAAKNNKAQSTVSESAEEEDEEEEEEDSSAESAEESAPTTRRTNRGRPKPAPKRTRKR